MATIITPARAPPLRDALAPDAAIVSVTVAADVDVDVDVDLDVESTVDDEDTEGAVHPSTL